MVDHPSVAEARTEIARMFHSANMTREDERRSFCFELMDAKYYGDPDRLIQKLGVGFPGTAGVGHIGNRLYRDVTVNHTRVGFKNHLRIVRPARGFEAFLYFVLEMDSWELIAFGYCEEILEWASYYGCKGYFIRMGKLLESVVCKDERFDLITFRGAVKHSDIKILGNFSVSFLFGGVVLLLICA